MATGEKECHANNILQFSTTADPLFRKRQMHQQFTMLRWKAATSHTARALRVATRGLTRDQMLSGRAGPRFDDDQSVDRRVRRKWRRPSPSQDRKTGQNYAIGGQNGNI